MTHPDHLPHDLNISVYGLTDPGPKVRVEARCARCGVLVAHRTFYGSADGDHDAEAAAYLSIKAFDHHVERCSALNHRRTR